jgi:channel protein (hemolysin III family)
LSGTTPRPLTIIGADRGIGAMARKVLFEGGRANGVLYTVGIIFFAYDSRFRHWHGIWHLFVMAGSLLHFVAILFYVL